MGETKENRKAGAKSSEKEGKYSGRLLVSAKKGPGVQSGSTVTCK